MAYNWIESGNPEFEEEAPIAAYLVTPLDTIWINKLDNGYKVVGWRLFIPYNNHFYTLEDAKAKVEHDFNFLYKWILYQQG